MRPMLLALRPRPRSLPRAAVRGLALLDRPWERRAIYDFSPEPKEGIPDSASGNDISTKSRFRYTGQAWIPDWECTITRPPFSGRELKSGPFSDGLLLNEYHKKRTLRRPLLACFSPSDFRECRRYNPAG